MSSLLVGHQESTGIQKVADHQTMKEPISITFDQLDQGFSFWQVNKSLSEKVEALQNQTVQIRGFLYHKLDEEGMWVLAAEPNLKSCCVGNKDKAGRQLIVNGDMLKDSSRATLLEGKLLISNQSQGYFYALNEAVIQREADSYSSPTYVAAFFSLCILLYCFSTSIAKSTSQK